MTHTLKQFGKVDGCANVAGVSGKEVSVRPVWEASSEDYDFVNAVNARGVFNCLSEQLRPGVVSEGGSVVNVSSIAGIRAMPKSAAYVASKHAVVGLTRVAAADAGPRNIRVNSVNP
jgi:NAD(P)-dependent dehydrogenase (short-subunit alcohol dehydrogenase family)